MEKIKRWTVYVLLFLLIATAFYSCDSRLDSSQPDKKKTVALILRMKHGDYWRTVKMGAEVAAKEYNLNLNYYAPDYEDDVKSQMELVAQAAKDGFDALVIAPSNGEILQAAVKLASTQPIPIIALDTEGEVSGVDSSIGTDNYDMGKKACEKMIELMGKHGQIALLGSGASTANAQRREQGVLDVIAHEPNVRMAASQYVQTDKKLAGELTRELIANSPEVQGIIALDAGSSIGAAMEIERMGLAGKVKVVAIDNPPEVLEYLQEGVIQATIIQKPFSMGYLGVKYALDVSDGKEVPKRFDTGTKVIDVENMFWSENQKLLFPFVK